MAKITGHDEDCLYFDDDMYIQAIHCPDCCEWNYADWDNLDTEALDYNFDTSKLKFEKAYGGFRFGDSSNRMFYVPCYSEQNGYYSSDLQLYYDGTNVLNCICEVVDG